MEFRSASPVRISENEHKKVIEESPADSRVVVCPDSVCTGGQSGESEQYVRLGAASLTDACV